MCFPDFIGLRPLGLPFAQGLAGKIPERSEDDFSCPAKPVRAALQQRLAIQDLCRLKAEKQILFCTDTKMQTFRPAFLWLY